MNSLIALASFSGIITGFLLAFIAPEELDPGRKYFKIFRDFTAICICTLTAAIISNTLLIPAITSILALIGILFIRKKEWTLYAHSALFSLSPLIFLCSSTTNTTILLASTIFLYGIPLGSLSSKPNDLQKSTIKILRNYGSYLLFTAILAFF